MKINTLYKNIFFMLSCTFSAALYASESNNNDFNLSRVIDGIFVHLGKHVEIDHTDNADIANIGFIIGDKCIAVIDTGGSVQIGKQLLQQIKAISDKPVCYVINTHVHFDHVLGNAAFAAEKPEFIGHHNLAAAIEQNRDFFYMQFRNNLGSPPDKNAIIGPSLLIEESRQLDLGNRVLTLMAFPVSHSHNDLIIIDQKTQTLWSGDLIFRQRIPSLTGSLKGWITAMKNLRRLEVKIVIPGHGKVATSIDVALEQQQGYLQRLLDDTRKAIAEGQFINDAITNIDKDNQSGWLLFDTRHPANVSKAFTELEWE